MGRKVAIVGVAQTKYESSNPNYHVEAQRLLEVGARARAVFEESGVGSIQDIKWFEVIKR
jgi:hypothetical protein